MAVHVGDSGVLVDLAVTEGGSAVDLTTATGLELHLRDPQGTALSWPAYLANMNHLRYATEAGDLNRAGQWEIRGHFTLGPWTGSTTAIVLTVSPV